ncbi:hypothetical protein [Polaribacter sp. R77954]|uniref:hypothetical protein n=1 Tax=Polaribacter sp. R77954 TaxID=3093870 RepID=UPI0037C83404
MEKKTNKLKNWINLSFKLLTIGMLGFSISLLINQQKEIKKIKGNLNDLEYNFDLSNIENKLDDVERQLYDVESNLSSEIEEAKKNILLWND